MRKLKILTLVLAIGIVSTFTPAIAKNTHICSGEFSTETEGVEKIDQGCVEGTILVDGNVWVNVPEQGMISEVSWITSGVEGNVRSEIRIDHSSSELQVSTNTGQDENDSKNSFTILTDETYSGSAVDNGCNSTSYAFGKSIFRGTPSIDWYYNSTSEPSNATHSIYRIGAAFVTWKSESNRCNLAAGNNALNTNYQGLTTAPESMGGNPPISFLAICPTTRALDWKNVIGWGLLPAGVVAATCIDFPAGEAKRDADIRFSTHYNWFDSASSSGCAQAFDLQDIATHEIGHMIGLDHAVAGTDQVMNPNALGCNFQNRKLARGDLAGFKALWGVN
jgi:hypothetical protein